MSYPLGSEKTERGRMQDPKDKSKIEPSNGAEESNPEADQAIERQRTSKPTTSLSKSSTPTNQPSDSMSGNGSKVEGTPSGTDENIPSPSTLTSTRFDYESPKNLFPVAPEVTRSESVLLVIKTFGSLKQSQETVLRAIQQLRISGFNVDHVSTSAGKAVLGEKVWTLGEANIKAV